MSNSKKDPSSGKLILSFKYALTGIANAVRSQQNLKIHLAISIVAVLLGIFLKIERLEWLTILVCMAVVFSAELMNTAVETVVDLVSPEFHPLAEKAKDVSAGAVLLASFFSLIIGAIIFIPKIISLFLQMSRLA